MKVTSIATKIAKMERRKTSKKRRESKRVNKNSREEN